MRKLPLIGFLALSACVTANSETVKDMPTGYLCGFLDPNTWVTTDAERKAIFAELKARDADCVLPSGSAKKNF
jgi:hypothetical protein